MPEPSPNPAPKAAAKLRWGGWRRVWQVLAVLLLLAAVFHRPLFHTVVRLALIQVAARQNVKLEVKFAGSIFTNLIVRDVQALPTGKGATPVEKITIEEVRLDYSLMKLLKGGVREFLSSYEVKNADLILAPIAAEKKEQKQSLARDLNNLLGQPALYADRVRIQNFNITIKGKDAVTEARGIDLLFDPAELGHLYVQRLAVPKLPVFEDLRAGTSYAQRNLFLYGLALTPDVVIDRFNFDASKRAERRGSMDLQARIFGGWAGVSLTGATLPKKGETLDRAYDTALRVDTLDLNVQKAADYFGAKNVPPLVLSKFALQVRGEPERPRTWTGGLIARVTGLALGKVALEGVDLDAGFEGGKAEVRRLGLNAGGSTVAFVGTALLPETINDFAAVEADGTLQLRAPDLAALSAVLLPDAERLAGSFNADGTVGFHQRRATGDLRVEAKAVAGKDFGVADASVSVRASKVIDAAEKNPFAGLEGSVEGVVRELRFQTYSADSLTLNGGIAEELVTLKALDLTRGKNSVSAQGTYRLPPPGTPLGPLDGTFRLAVPELDAFGIVIKDLPVGGRLAGEGTFRTQDGKVNGTVTVDGGSFSLGEFVTGDFLARVALKNDVAEVDELRLDLPEKGRIGVTGQYTLTAPGSYEGALLVVLPKLAALQPLLATLGVKDAVSGALDFNVEGKGKLGTAPAHDGKLQLKLDKARYGKVPVDEFRLAGVYGPRFAESSELRVVSGQTTFAGALAWVEGKLRLKDIDLRQGTQQVLTGFASVPFDPENPKELIPLEGRVAVNVNAKDLNIEKLLVSIGQEAPVTGSVSATLLGGGSLLRPTAFVKVTGRNLRSPAAEKFAPAELDFTANYEKRELTVDAVARQPLIQPITVKGRVPLNLEGTLQQKKLDPDLPLDLAVRLPPTSLAFVSLLVPTVRKIEGTAALDVRLTGTVKAPKFAGAATVKADFARLEGEGVPAIGQLAIDIPFTNDGAQIRTFRGEIGGGTFEMKGGVKVPQWPEAVFDLRLQADDVLVKRDDSVTVRVDTDVSLAGPLAGAAVRGTIWAVNSRFFREIDILPIGLPGRPKPRPAPRSVAAKGGPPVKLPPIMKDWKFDVAIRTRPENPFKIRGNLANGSATADLRFGGTGATPTLDGTVRVDNFVASLPFSKLTISRGFITFGPDQPFEPKLDIQAESNLRDYRISAYVYGTARAPQLSLTSEPPLPQQDIISLLATGTTTAELTGSSDVLAGRAAVLLFTQLYRKVFKKKDPVEKDQALDRFDFDVGSVDNRTGRQEVSGRFKINDQYYLIGDLDVSGEFTGRVKYLLRFR